MRVSFECQSKEFKNAIQRALRFAPSTVSIGRGGVKITVKNSDFVLIQATKDGVTYSETLYAKCEKAGELVLDGKTLKAMLKAFSKELNKACTLGFAFDDAEIMDYAKIKIGELKTSIPVYRADKYQLVQGKNETLAVVFEPFTLQEIIEQTAWACSNDELRPIYTGAFFEIAGDELNVVATNTHRLAVYEGKSGSDAKDFRRIIPRKVLDELLRLVKAIKNPISLYDTENDCVTFEIGKAKITTTVPIGEFPNWRRAVPKKFTAYAILNSTELLSALKRLLPVVDEDDYSSVKFSFAADGLTLRPCHHDHGELEQVACKLEGKPVEIAFNCHYVIDELKAMPENQLCKISLIDALSPIVITQTPEYNSTYVLTPIRQDKK